MYLFLVAVLWSSLQFRYQQSNLTKSPAPEVIEAVMILSNLTLFYYRIRIDVDYSNAVVNLRPWRDGYLTIILPLILFTL